MAKELTFDTAAEHIFTIEQHELDRYHRFIQHMRPNNLADRFRRWIFAYASVHTTWKLNCRLYKALEDLEWLGDDKELHKRITESGAGFQNNRTKFISQFSENFWRHPGWFDKTKFESWQEYRQRVRQAALGLGFAKSTFSLELLYPATANVVCVDTHVLQLYGFTPAEINKKGPREKDYQAIENHWVEQCRAIAAPPVLARWIFWDRKQGHGDSRYWTYVFEKEKWHDRLAQLTAA